MRGIQRKHLEKVELWQEKNVDLGHGLQRAHQQMLPSVQHLSLFLYQHNNVHKYYLYVFLQVCSMNNDKLMGGAQ